MMFHADQPQGSTFTDLPAALVDEVLSKTSDVAKQLLNSFQQIRLDRKSLRAELDEKELLISESVLGFPPLPTTCATDGSYAIERLLTTDLAAAAAVAVEGLTPPSELRHWEQPRHKSFIAAENHVEDTGTILRAVMLGEELKLATNAPHELVMLDGTLTLPIIYFNQALNKMNDVAGLKCAKEFRTHAVPYLKAYHELLSAGRSDKQYAGIPKYSTRREIGLQLQWPHQHDDRGMLTLLLNPGELTKPCELDQPRTQDGKLTWHLNTGGLSTEIRKEAKSLADEIIEAIGNIYVFYYKPHDWLPALRVEVSKAIATNNHRLALVVQGLKHQCATPSMLEPYPVYLADRTAKALARALPAFRQVTTQTISETYDGDVGEVFFAMHGYRSETGR